MNKKFFLCMAAATVFTMLSACGDNVVEATSGDDLASDPIQTQAKLNVLVTDASNGKPVAATVVLLSVNDTVAANAAGTAVFEKIFVGSYALLVEADGYASMISTADISGDQSENIYIANESTVSIQLYPLTSTLDGYAYYTDNAGKSLPAAGAKIRIQLYGGFVNKIFETTVGAGGKYVFEGLPAVGYDYDIWALEWKDAAGKAYGTISLNQQDLIAGSPAHIDDLAKYESPVSVFDLIGYNSLINSGDTIVFEFSDSIDVQKTTNGTIDVLNSSYATAAADVVYAGNKVKIIPVGKWQSNLHVGINGLVSKNNKSFSNDYDIYLLSVDLGNVSAAAFNFKNLDSASNNYNTQYTTLQWNKIPGATGYNVFVKKAGTESYEEAELYNTINDTTKQFSFTNYYNNLDSDTYTFIIQAVNNGSKSPLNGAASVNAYDRVAPTTASSQKVFGDSVVYFDDYSPDDFGFYYALDYYLSLPGAYDVTTFYVYFTEPMDTTAAITGAFVPAAGAERLDIKREWDLAGSPDGLCLKLTFSIKAGAPIVAPINAIYSISGLKDKKGNAFSIAYPDAAPTPITSKNTLDFRFVADVSP